MHVRAAQARSLDLYQDLSIPGSGTGRSSMISGYLNSPGSRPLTPDGRNQEC